MKLSPEQVEEILNEAKPDIIAGLKQEIVNQVKWDLSRMVGAEVSKEVQRFVSEEIIPEIRGLLVESKQGLIATAVPLGEAIVEELIRGLATDAKKNLENSYTRSEILKQLFR